MRKYSIFLGHPPLFESHSPLQAGSSPLNFDLKQGRGQAHENVRSESEGALLRTKALPATEPLRSVEHTTLKTTL